MELLFQCLTDAKFFRGDHKYIQTYVNVFIFNGTKPLIFKERTVYIVQLSPGSQFEDGPWEQGKFKMANK